VLGHESVSFARLGLLSQGLALVAPLA